MKIKKFKNLWLMGIIIFIVILVGLYIIKLVFPSFIIGIAEIESVVTFGEYVDTHWWAYYLFNFCVGIITYFFYCCACCRKNKLTWIDLLFVSIVNIILLLVQKFLPDCYTYINTISLIIVPCIICLKDKRTEIKYFYSTTTVFTIHIIAELLSLRIRDLISMITKVNVASFTILLIDGFIWLVLLYNFYNYIKCIKEDIKNGI